MLCLLLLTGGASGLISKSNTGDWPKDWPKELDVFRKSASTLMVGTGIQENIYEIRFTDRDQFEKAWQAVEKVRTPGGVIRLYRVNSSTPWGSVLPNKQPVLRVYGPSGGYSLDPKLDTDPTKRLDLKNLLKSGRALKAGSPWAQELVGENGQLPEYVTSVVDEDGKMSWRPVDRKKGADGFLNRARIDLELVVDGDIIDLNRIKLPRNAEIVDLRFAAAKKQDPAPKPKDGDEKAKPKAEKKPAK